MGKTIMYERIYADLLAKIQNGDYQPGDRLPSEKESAELYGVSRITAKKAMDMLAKEKKISREPGRGSFVCSPAAAVEMKKESRGTANQRIGVIFDGFGSDFGTRLLQGIESECDRRQSDLLFKCTYGSIEKEKQAIDAAIRAGVKGILLLCAQGDNYNSKVLELALNGYPLVLMDRRMQGISIPCVRTDNYEAANEVTKILIAMGHKKICFLTHASVTTTTIHERYEGFAHCMLKYEDANGTFAKLEKYNHIPEDIEKECREFDYAQIAEILEKNRECTAYIAAEYRIGVLFSKYLKEHGIEEEQIISINFEDLDYEELTDYRKLYKYLKERLIDGKMTYIFLDEIQNVTDFPKVLDSLYIKKNIDIYVTGSNAYMLSSEIATMISGRYIQIEMLPLSFKEYMESTGSMNDRGIKYAEYLQNSSFPFTLELKNQPDEIRDYLEGIYNTIVVKDIINRKKITDTMMLKSVLRFVFDNIGNPLSSKKIADTMTSEGRKIDTKTVEKYLEAFSESYIIYQAKRYNIKGKQYLKTLEKYYIVDIGMRYMLLGSRQADAGHVLENIVYLELLRRGYDVYVGKINSYEVDFVAQNKKGTVYFQVALTVRDENTLLRELRPLQAIRDHYPKIILTMDEEPEEQYEGIRRINARDWLLGIVD